MYKKHSTQSTPPSTQTSFTRLTLSLAACLALSATTGAAASLPGNSESDPAPSLSLVFSDDFTTDPNTNGQWSIHRYVDDPDTEAVWDSAAQAWHLTLPATYRAVAAFANYDLTTTHWRAEFRYKVSRLGGVNGGGDGFVFMFYKDKGAYGTPLFGQWMGFEVQTGAAPGYGLEFDNYDSGGCDPTPNDYYAIIKDHVCYSALTGRQDDWAGDNKWHNVQFVFDEGTIRMSIDGETTLRYQITNPDYTYSGIGFGTGTGSAFGDYEIDNFRLWVAQ